MVFDGLLYVIAMVFGNLLGSLSSKEAYEYISPYYLFWSKVIFNAAIAGSLAAKAYRSTSYSDHETEKDNAHQLPDPSKPQTIVPAAVPGKV